MGAYSGQNKYIFVSYCHEDNNVVLPIIKKMQEHYNVWYDDGIGLGEVYTNTIIDHIDNCSLFIFMVSKNSLNSKFCKKEIRHANRKEKIFFNVIIEDCDDDKEWERFLFDYEEYQMSKFYEIGIDKFIEDLHTKAPKIIKECIANPSEQKKIIEKVKVEQPIKEKKAPIIEEAKVQPKREQKVVITPKTRYDSVPLDMPSNREEQGEKINLISCYKDFETILTSDLCNFNFEFQFKDNHLPQDIFNTCNDDYVINPLHRYLLSACYYLGIGVEINLAKSVELMISALEARRGLNKDAYNCGLWFLYGIGSQLTDYDRSNPHLVFKNKYCGPHSGAFYPEFFSLVEDEFSKLIMVIRRSAKEENNNADYLIREIESNEKITNTEKEVLLGLFNLLITKDKHESIYHYQLAIKQGSFLARLWIREVDLSSIEYQKFRIENGQYFAVKKYLNCLGYKEISSFTNNKEAYDIVLKCAKLGDDFAIGMIYHFILLSGNEDPFEEELINSLFDIGLKKGSNKLLNTKANHFNGKKGHSLKYRKELKELNNINNYYQSITKSVVDFIDYLDKKKRR